MAKYSGPHRSMTSGVSALADMAASSPTALQRANIRVVIQNGDQVYVALHISVQSATRIRGCIRRFDVPAL